MYITMEIRLLEKKEMSWRAEAIKNDFCEGSGHLQTVAMA
jgi:hypothetical protein